jgi:UDP-glucuronate 4-epimerase
MSILVTGAAGFIGFHTALRLLSRGERVIGVDNLNEYYSVSLKRDRVEKLSEQDGFTFHHLDLADAAALEAALAGEKITTVIHLAAQAGVRYSISNPHSYARSNLVGHLNVLEYCRHCDTLDSLVYASSSSVYGGNSKLPFAESDRVDDPVSLYAATKKSNELMSHVYAHLYRFPITGLRFFTVYGPWYRPDMALFLFTRAILAGEPIKVFNNGEMQRDFTYIDDIVEGVKRIGAHLPQPNPLWDPRQPDPGTSRAPYRLYNIGNNQPVQLMRLIEVLEDCLGKKAVKEMLPMQPGDVPMTYADVDDLAQAVDFRPHTPIEEGVEKFVRWYRDFYRV